MRQFALIIFLTLSRNIANAQIFINLKGINNFEASANEDQQDISRLNIILTQQFLLKANNSRDKINKQIQDFFSDYKINKRNLEQYKYPKQLSKSHLSILVTGYDYTWGLPPASGDTSKFEGYRNKTLRAVATIPVYDNYHRGYSINSVSFACTLTEVITWTETRGNKQPIEKLPTYKREIQLEGKLIDLDR